MELRLGIASRREVRDYDARPIPEDVQRQILDAGRLAGSAKNRQPWRFVLVEDAGRRERLAELVYEPENVRGAQLVVAIALGG
jgi:nitroreductase